MDSFVSTSSAATSLSCEFSCLWIDVKLRLQFRRRNEGASRAVAVVTGAGSGIGRALAQELASTGAELALADVNGAALEKTLALLSSTTARTYPVDVANPSAVDQFALQVHRDFGRVCLLINNAGVALHGTFAEVSLADMEWLFRINFWGVIHGYKSFLPLLEQEPDAHIVNVSSVYGLFGPPGQAAYASSKFAVRGFTEVLRHELKATNIRVSCVHPAGIHTAIAENARSDRGQIRKTPPCSASVSKSWLPYHQQKRHGGS